MLAFVACTTAAGGQAQAQAVSADEHAAAAAAGGVQEVVVVGYRQSLSRSSEDKRRAEQVVDVITAEEFGKFPDQNVAEAIQRIPGISMERTSGEGDKITIRGLEPDLTRVEVNGRSTRVIGNVEAPDPASSLSIFGSDQFAKIEVVKSPQAKDDEGGVGGIVRLITAKPLDIGRFAARLSAQARYNDYSGKTDPMVAAMASNVFLDGKLGLLGSVSYDKGTKRTDQTRNQNGWLPAPTSQTGRPQTLPLRGEVYSTHFDQQFGIVTRPRLNLDGTLQYRPTDAFELYVNANYAHEELLNRISRVAINTARNRPFISGTLNSETGTVDSLLMERGLFTFQNRGLNRETESLGLTVRPRWETENWTFSLRADYSLGEQIGYDRRIRSRIERDVGYDIREDYRSPVLIAPGLNVLDLTAFKVDQNLNEYGKARSSEVSYQADVTRRLDGLFTKIEAGVKVRDARVAAAQGPVEGPTTFTFADAASDFPLDEFFKGHGGDDFLRVWPYVDAQSFVDQFGPTEADAAAAINPALSYDVRHDVIAAYGQTSFETDLGWAYARGNAGVRVVKTDFFGNGSENFTIGGVKSVLPVTSESSSTNGLPSFNMALEPAAIDGLIVRMAAGRVMTQPRFTEINPTAVLSEDDLTIRRGNPALRPFVADAYDLGVEYYFGRGNYVSVALFRKDIKNFVEPISYFEDYTFPGASSPEEVVARTYRNGGKGQVSGLEFSAQAPFTFLPAPLDGFGAILNYTRLESSRTLATGEEVEIPGNSPTTLNATLYYEKGGFQARVAYNYRDDFLKEQFGPGNNAIYVEGQGRVDLTAGYRFDNGTAVTAHVANLTEEGRYEYSGQVDRVMLHQLEGRVYSIGLSQSF